MRFKKCRTFELKLIAAVKRRPELFSFNKIVPTTRWKLIAAWNEVSRLLGVRAHLCKKRWDSLMPTFLQRCAKRESQKANWPYYERMSFLLEYHDVFRFFNSSDTLIVVNAKTLLVRLEPLQIKVESVLPRQTGERQLPAACDHDAVTHDSTTHQERPWFRIAKVRSMHADSEMTRSSTNANHHPPGELSAKSSTVDRRWTPGTYDGDPHVSYKTIDSDEQFLKSCYTTMKRLSTSQNSFVRVRIQQLLYEVEFPDKNDTSNGF